MSAATEKIFTQQKDKTVQLFPPSGERPFISVSQHEPPEKRGPDKGTK